MDYSISGCIVPRTLPQLLIFQHVECRELLRIHALQAENLYAGP